MKYLYNNSKSYKMAKNKIKIQFFQNQIENLLDFKQTIEQLGKFLRIALTFNNVKEQINALYIANQNFKEEIKLIKSDIQKTKRESDLNYDEAKLQEKIIFRSLDDKIQQLNQRLFAAQNGVQKAESLKKQRDALNAEYQMANYKNIKKQSEKYVINPYIECQSKVINEFKRSINLMMKISQRKNKSSEYQSHQLLNLLKMRTSRLNYKQMRRSQLFGQSRKALSQQKRPISQLQDKNSQFHIPQKKKIQPLISVLLKSAHIPYKDERQSALSSMILRLRQNNKKEAGIIKILKNGIELKNRDQVRKFLQSKSQLNQEECIMKIQLMSSKLIENIEQRFLSLKLKSKPSFQFHQGENNAQEWQIERRVVKSLQKLWNNANFQSQKKKHIKKLSLTHNMMGKPSNSNPKTTDSSKNQMAL